MPPIHKTRAKRVAVMVMSLVAALVMVLPATATAAGASITVTNQNDSGPGSLRQAIADATPGDTVIVPAGMYLLSSELRIDKSLTVAGAGAASTIIDAQTASRVVHTLGAGNQITISGATIRNGRTVPPPGLATTTGGGLLNDQATVTLSDDVITNNVANADG